MTVRPKDKVVGILGGMGPAATLDLLSKVLRHTPATRDQEHLRILVDINPKVPDRVAAILEGGEDPGPVLVEMARGLERMGAGLLAIACNTAHYWWQATQEAVGVPVLHMIRETVRYLEGLDPVPRTAGLLASNAVVRVGLYQEALRDAGIEVVVPSDPAQERVMRVIWGVKGGEDPGSLQSLLRSVADEVVTRGAQCVIAGCTEIPIVLPFVGNLGVPVVDATDVLARAIVREAMAVKEECQR
ncbi:MAG: amino acid racemase [Bacillota bacterium]